MSHLRITADVHGHVKQYVNYINELKAYYSLQLGDMGFDYQELSSLNKDRHKFIGGNHDNYDKYYSCPHALKDYGDYELGGIPFFYIRGALSIDHKQRRINEKLTGLKNWWSQEQLSSSKLQTAINKYTRSKPNLMITHTCPDEIAKRIGNDWILESFGYSPKKFRTDTQMALQACFDAHQPKVHIFGHFHKDICFKHKGTLFICMKELSGLTISKKGILKHKRFSVNLTE